MESALHIVHHAELTSYFCSDWKEHTHTYTHRIYKKDN